MGDEETRTKNVKETTEEVHDDDKKSIQNKAATAKENCMMDLQNKMGIVYNVLKACIKENNENTHYYRDFIIHRMVHLTKMQPYVLYKIKDKIKEVKKIDIFEETVLETPDIDLLIRQKLIQIYVKDNKIPTAESLKFILNEHCYGYQLHEQLKRSGYIWRRVPNTKRAIIVEHPKRAIERQWYLRQIINYRKMNRCIVYIETKILNKADKHICHFQKFVTEDVNFIMVFMAVTNRENWFLGGHIFSFQSIFKCQKIIEDHIIKNILPSLSRPSVIIVEDKPYFSKTLPVPTIESEKSEMMKWLKTNGILHEDNLHRSELFELIQGCKVKRDLHSFDAIINAHGHEIIRRPSRTEYLNYYNPLWANIHSTEDILIRKKSPQFWSNLENSLILNEKAVYHEDLTMENIIDKILTMANHIDVNEWANVECDEEHDSLMLEELVIAIKNSFSLDELKVREGQFLVEIEKHLIPAFKR